MKPFTLVTPKTITEASSFLKKHGDDGRAIAGGTALVIMMKERVFNPEYLVDLRGLKPLRYVRLDKTRGLRIGSLTTHRMIEQSPIVAKRYPALKEAFETIGNVRIRNVGTIGGNLAYAEPQCNPPTVLSALDAEIIVSGLKGSRRIQAEKFITGIYETQLKPSEVITEIIVPPMPPKGSCKFLKFTSRSEEDKPTATVACFLQLDAKGVCKTARLTIGAVGPVIYRCGKSESILQGKPLSDQLLAEAADSCTDSVKALDDIYGSPWFKLEVSRVLMLRALKAAWKEVSS